MATGFVVMACAGETAPPGGGFQQRDSLGITIYENSVVGPRVEATEVLRIGAVDGPTETTFNRITDARVGPGGTLIAVDGGDNLIKMFDESGAPLRTMGGEGEGPAEFQAASNLALRGDTLWVLDWRLRKIVRFDIGGALIDTRRIEFTSFLHGFPADFALWPGGRVAIVGMTGCALPRRPAGDNMLRVFTFGSDGAVLDSLVREFRGNAIPVYATTARGGSCTVVQWPFGPAPALALEPGGGAYRSDGEVFEVTQLDATLGDVVSLVRYRAPRRPVTAAERQAFADSLAERGFNADLQRAVEQAVDSTGYPDTWPAISALEAGGDGTVWAQRARPLEDADQEWDVLMDGRHVLTVALPNAFRVLHVANGDILGVLTDELDVQYLALFRCRMSDSPSSTCGA